MKRNPRSSILKASGLSAAVKRDLLRSILETRQIDLREENLSRQGNGQFHVSSQGHEALAAFGMLMAVGDYACPYYRDRALVVGRGVTARQLALDFLAKAASSSSGRQMPAHFSFPEYHIWSVPTPTASQLLPACGMAWGMKLEGKPNLTIATVGDAATRQGDFYEAIAFAKERQLPLLLIVEDNGYGISSPTRLSNPMALNVLAHENWHFVDGWDMEGVYRLAKEQMERIRAGSGPVFVWVKMERISNHTSTDDQKLYRQREELATLDQRDPLKVFAAQLAAEEVMSTGEFLRLEEEAKERVRAEYAAAEQAADPEIADLETQVLAPPEEFPGEIFAPGKYRMGDIINLTLRAGLEADPHRTIFGEDVEDPKGGVFTLTKGLSTEFPDQVYNSPLAESTILGVACGLASYGWRPVFEVQFIDFIHPGWNQLVTNLSTLRWRTNGKWTCPTVIYAPYGAYLPGGSLWHSQANESAIAHFPGLNVVVPSTPEDAAGLLWTAMKAQDPTIFLIPKHMLWVEREVTHPIAAIPLGRARCFAEGTDVTIVAWGNTVEKSLEAIAELGAEASVELIDLRSIVPWDRKMIEESVRKTGRLIVVQEDSENCSVGQMIISHIVGRPDVWMRMVSPPILVSKGNVMIGYSPICEFAALPDTPRIIAAVRRSLVAVASVPDQTSLKAPGHLASQRSAAQLGTVAQVAAVPPEAAEFVIKVPVMGQGIREARIVALHKKPGDLVAADEVLCEVETDKAVYPIQAPQAGVFRAWVVRLDETVEIGSEIAIIAVAANLAVAGGSWADRLEGPPHSAAAAVSSAPVRRAETPVEPALAPAIIRRLHTVIPANMQLDVHWQPIRQARDAGKSAGHNYSPSLIFAWCIVRAMTKHAAFRRLVHREGVIVETTDFDLGMAVGLPEGRLASAAIHHANRMEWPSFAAAYAKAIVDVREGQVDEVQAPINLTTLGAFEIEQAAPIVVPPAMGTIFVGKAHQRMMHGESGFYPLEVATLSLTFDHKVVNGAGAAAFLQEVRLQAEHFRLPRGAGWNLGGEIALPVNSE